MEKRVFITGGNRGIGLEFVKYYATQRWNVVVATRHPTSESMLALQAQYNNLQTIQLDVTDFGQYDQLEQYFQDKPIDLLINNAGISGMPGQTIGHVNADNLQHVFSVNTFAPIMLIQSLLPALLKGNEKTIVNITSKMGSIADNTSGRSYAYRSSKTALNAIMRSLQIDIQDQGVKVLLLHPGWVKTDMGGPEALIDTKTSINGMIKVIEQAHTLPDQFYDYQGQVIPW